MSTATLERPAQGEEIDPQDFPDVLDHYGQMERKLRTTGWKLYGRERGGQFLWKDPQGTDGMEKGVLGEPIGLPAEGGGTTYIRQLTFKPLSWTYPTEQAFNVQCEREDGEARYQEAQQAKKEQAAREEAEIEAAAQAKLVAAN